MRNKKKYEIYKYNKIGNKNEAGFCERIPRKNNSISNKTKYLTFLRHFYVWDQGYVFSIVQIPHVQVYEMFQEKNICVGRLTFLHSHIFVYNSIYNNRFLNRKRRICPKKDVVFFER